jgi:hypothetical protein
MADLNYDPNARYDHGSSAAGTGRVSNQNVLLTSSAYGSNTGLGTDGALHYAEVRTGFHAAGLVRSNIGPNVAGAPRSVNNT